MQTSYKEPWKLKQAHYLTILRLIQWRGQPLPGSEVIIIFIIIIIVIVIIIIIEESPLFVFFRTWNKGKKSGTPWGIER